ncbi:MAG: hypothetical protein ABFC57_04030 [Veillonellales bacterium]
MNPICHRATPAEAISKREETIRYREIDSLRLAMTVNAMSYGLWAMSCEPTTARRSATFSFPAVGKSSPLSNYT